MPKDEHLPIQTPLLYSTVNHYIDEKRKTITKRKNQKAKTINHKYIFHIKCDIQ